MRRISGIVSRRHAVVALTGVAAVASALVGSPAGAFVQPTGVSAAATGTLALCVGAEQGATTYVYAEPIAAAPGAPPGDMDPIPSQLTQLIVGAPGPNQLTPLDCRAYPADPGSYVITSYKYPKVPCPVDQTRPNNNTYTDPNPSASMPETTVPKGECLARVHHIHVIHLSGTITAVDTTGTPTLASGGTPFCAANGNSPNAAAAGGGGHQATVLGSGACTGTPDKYDFGIEYTNELLSSPPGVEDTIVEEKQAIVQVVSGQTTEVVNHVPDHEVSECSPNFDPDVNNNAPICN